MAPPPPDRATKRTRDWPPTLALTAAAAMLALSLFFPYWEMTMTTPARPAAVHLVSYLDHLEGPLDALAGTGATRAAQLRELSELERSLAVATITVISLLVVAATFVHNRWAALLSLPAFVFPAVVVADTARWLRPILDGLDAPAGDAAPSSLSLVFGRTTFGATLVDTRPGAGLLLAAAASTLILAGLWLHRRAYKPAGVFAAGRDGRAAAERATRVPL